MLPPPPLGRPPQPSRAGGARPRAPLPGTPPAAAAASREKPRPPAELGRTRGADPRAGEGAAPGLAAHAGRECPLARGDPRATSPGAARGTPAVAGAPGPHPPTPLPGAGPGPPSPSGASPAPFLPPSLPPRWPGSSRLGSAARVSRQRPALGSGGPGHCGEEVPGGARRKPGQAEETRGARGQRPSAALAAWGGGTLGRPTGLGASRGDKRARPAQDHPARLGVAGTGARGVNSVRRSRACLFGLPGPGARRASASLQRKQPPSPAAGAPRPAGEEWEVTAPDPLPPGPPQEPGSRVFRRQSPRLPRAPARPHPAQNAGARPAAVTLAPGRASEPGF
ncbi:collagen alpha-1(I) chain-like [Pongo abelii]|uniref:collagen alpha-1(I) chain-like n=1 Tax=Pongo abelii TaxID=9601 RepID=UPI003005B035